jgi:hypothetical protein
MSAKEAHTLRDCIEVAIMDYDARQESGAQPPQADNKPSVPCITCEICGLSAPFVKTETGYRCQTHWGARHPCGTRCAKLTGESLL